MNRMILAFALTPLAIGQTLTTTTIATSANPSVFGQAVTLSATVSPSQAAGSVTFYDGTIVLGTHNVVSGLAAISVILPASGVRSLKARFSGATGYASGTSSVLSQSVNAAPATTLLAPVQYATAMSIYQNVATADFNGDGKMDIVTNNATILFGHGDGTFEKPVSYTSPGDSYSVVTGDFNGDGKPDFATAGYDASLSVWLNNGDGTFKSPSTVSLTATPVGIATGDFNNDGIVDIAIASRQGSATGLGILIGVGDGTFRPVVNYLGTRQSSLAVADFNGDGNADIVVASSDIFPAVTILLGNGDGTFKTGATYGASFPYFVATGDFNRDGKPDFVVDNFNIGQLYVFLGNGDGTFTQTSTSPLANGFQNEEVVVGDFDGDGIPDLATTNPNPTQPDPVSVLLGNGDGTFRGAVNFPAGSGGRALVAGEFNGDGRTDLLVTNQSSLQVLLGGTGAFPMVTTTSLPGAMAGTFYSATLTATGGTTPYTWSVSAGSSPIPLSPGGVIVGTAPTTTKTGLYAFSVTASGPNGGGYRSGQYLSVTIAAPFKISIFALFVGSVGTSYTLQPTASGGTPPYQNWVVSSGSLPPGLSIDRATGLITGTPTAAGTFSFSLTVNDSAGLTSLPDAISLPVVSALTVSTPTLPNAVTGVPYYALLAGAGGFPPYANWMVSSGSLPPGLALNSSSGAISGTPTTSDGSPFLFSITMHDGSGQGQVSAPQPLAIAVSDPSSITVSLGTSANPSKFGTPLTLTATLSLSGAAGKVTFYDGSNVLGTAGVASGQSVFTTSLLCSGTHKLIARFFGPPSAPTVSAVVSQVVSAVARASLQAPVTYASGYFSSGNTPFAVADFNGDGKSDLATFGSVLLGNGDGTFGTPLIHSVGTNALSLVTGDFNEDGIPDIAVSDNNGIEVFPGKGDGTFGPSVAYGGFSVGVGYLAVGDFNGDGHADLIGNSGLVLYLGVGDGTFRPATTIATGTGGAVAVDDFNGDGKPDVAIANASSVSIVFGNGDGTFQPPVNYTVPATNTGYVQNFVNSADLNGDGIPDLVFNASGQVNVMLGHGDGTFGQPYLCFNSAELAPVVVNDFNGDGIPDLAVSAGSYPMATAIFPGKGDGTFGEAVSYAVGNGAFELAVGDFNGDGRPDIVAGNGERNVYMQLATSAPEDSQLTVSPAKLSVTQPPVTGSSPQTVTLTYQTDVQGAPAFVAGFSNSDGFEVLTVSPASGTMTQASHTGSLYTYTAGVTISVSDPGIFPGTSDRNTVNFAVGGPIVVFPVTVASQYAAQTITFATLYPQSLGATPAALSATSTSGIPVTFASLTPAVCTVSGTTTVLVSAGTCSIQASEPQNTTWASAYVTQSFTVYPKNVPPPPVPQPTGGIANAASAGQAAPSVVSPGSYVAIYGTFLAGNGNPSATTLPLATTLNGTQATLCGVPMPLLYASATQINALIPQGVAPGGGCPLTVTGGTVQSAPIQLTVRELQPGIYTVDESGSGAGIVTNALTGQLISASNPAHASDYLVIYCTGLGLLRGPQAQPGPTDGAAAPLSTLFYTDATVTATIGGINAPVDFSGLTPTLAGLYQVNIRMPAGVAPGNAVPLVITATDAVTGATARSNSVTIVVR